MTHSELDLGTLTFPCTAEEVASVFASLLGEMQAAAPLLRADERETLRRIMAHDSETLTVGDVFPAFERQSDALMTLRRLRTAQFIRPAGRDMWDRDQRIAIKPFARLAWERLGEAGIFGDAPDHTEPEEEEIDLSLPEVNEPNAEETVLVKNKKSEVWEDDDVLDFLNESKDGAN